MEKKKADEGKNMTMEMEQKTVGQCGGENIKEGLWTIVKTRMGKGE